MLTPRLTTASLLSGLLLTAGCARHALNSSSPAPTAVVTITEQNANQLVSLRPGDKLVVNLPLRNGGQWQLLQSATPVLLTNYTPTRVTPYEGHSLQPSTLSNGRPSGYVFVANALGTELLQFATSGGTGYTGTGNTYAVRVQVLTPAPAAP
jgi:hypothetical protein